jgi:hypothetical protein
MAAKQDRAFKGIYLRAKSYWVTREGRTITDRASSGKSQTTQYPTVAAAESRFAALVARYTALKDKEDGTNKARAAKPVMISAPKLKRTRALTASELERIATRWPPGTRWQSSDVTKVEGAFPGLRLPAGFRAFAARVGASGDDDLRMLSAREMIRDTKQLVRVPRGTRWVTDDGREVRIHTDHLVAFAAAGPETRWCFCIDAVGEPTVYEHHQDEPRARIRDGNGDRGWISAAAAKPDFADFAAWLRKHAPRR